MQSEFRGGEPRGDMESCILDFAGNIGWIRRCTSILQLQASSHNSTPPADDSGWTEFCSFILELAVHDHVWCAHVMCCYKLDFKFGDRIAELPHPLSTKNIIIIIIIIACSMIGC